MNKIGCGAYIHNTYEIQSDVSHKNIFVRYIRLYHTVSLCNTSDCNCTLQPVVSAAGILQLQSDVSHSDTGPAAQTTGCSVQLRMKIHRVHRHFKSDTLM